MLRLLLVLCALVLLIASGITQRLWTGAWTASDEPATSAARLANVPLTIGDWHGQALEMDEKQLEQAEAIGHLARRYIQRRTGAEVSILIVCGRPGPIAVHPPNICYGGIGFEAITDQSRYKVEADEDVPEAEFFKIDMSKVGAAVPSRLRIYWAWRAAQTQTWRAPTYPRMTFGGARALYKLYLIYRPLPTAKMPEPDPCVAFMRDLLPELDKALSPAP